MKIVNVHFWLLAAGGGKWALAVGCMDLGIWYFDAVASFTNLTSYEKQLETRFLDFVYRLYPDDFILDLHDH